MKNSDQFQTFLKYSPYLLKMGRKPKDFKGQTSVRHVSQKLGKVKVGAEKQATTEKSV